VGKNEFGGFADHKDDDYRLNNFQMTTNNNDHAKELTARKLLDFKRFLVDMKDIKSPLLWWEKHNCRFLVVGLQARHILGIVGFQIEMEHFFLLD
jgi:hypothetical protein